MGSGSDPAVAVGSGHDGLVVADEGPTVGPSNEGNTGNAVMSRVRKKTTPRGWVT